MSAQAYPLAWPIRWPRTKNREESRFQKPGKATAPGAYAYPRRHSIDEARRFLSDELNRLGGSHPILSTNLILRLDGQPRGGQPQPTDPGVAVYFDLMGRPTVLACDKWQHVECNIYALAKHIEAMRGQQRWGVGTTEQAFAGYMALEHRTQADCWETLGIPPNSPATVVMDAYRRMARKTHPDNGGSAEAFQAVCAAKDIALSSIPK